MPVLDDAGRTCGAGCRGVNHHNAARGRGSRPWSDDLSLTRREIDRERERERRRPRGLVHHQEEEEEEEEGGR